MSKTLRMLVLAFVCLALSMTAISQTQYYVSPTGNNSNDGLSAATAKATIQAALNAAVAGDVINVAAGTYAENVTISKSNVKLYATNGRAATTIRGTLAGGLGTIRVTTGVNGVEIGAPGKGFTIVGFDGTGAAEAAALYLIGAHTDIVIAGNEIVANGDHGLLSDNNAAIDRITINDNIFSGKTFLGAEPGDCGFSNQFAAGNNTPRQLVVMGGGAGVTNSKNVVFTNNQLIGTTGGYNSASGCEQGNSLVTIDVIGATITGNTFNGVTTRGAYSLRARGKATSISCNTFLSGGLSASCTHIFLGSANPLTGASPASLEGIAQSNAFPNGGAYLTPNVAATYVIFRDLAQANTAAATLNAGQTAIAAAAAVTPTISAPANIQTTADAGNCGAVVNLGTPVTNASPCAAIATISNNAPAVFPVGTTVVTWTVTDVAGKTASAQQTVTVTDNEKPKIRAGRISRLNDAGVCGATINLPLPAATDNCGIASITNNATSSFFPIGITTIIWTVTDVHGNQDTLSQRITVVDNELPVFTAVANQQFCSNGTGQYTVPAAVATDNCGIAGYSYTVTGATTRSGEGADASGSFNIGQSTVTIIARDNNNNTQSISYTVQVSALPSASFTITTEAWCNTVNLTAAGGSTYSWKQGNTVVSTDAILRLGLTQPDGVYNLVTTNEAGCSSAPASYTYNKQQFAVNYTLLGYTQVNLGNGNKLLNGSLGVMNAGGTASFENNSSVNATGAFVKAPRVTRNGSNIDIASTILAPATVALPVMQYNNTSTKSLPNATVAANSTTTLNGNYASLTVRKGANVVINGSLFGTISIEAGAKVRFTAASLDIANLNIDKGSSSFTELRFAAGSSIRVNGKVTVGAYTRINPDNQQVTFYMGDNNKDEETFTVTGTNISVVANIYIPNGVLSLVSDDKGRTVTTITNVNMVGRFIAEKIKSTITNATWSSYDCSNPATVASTAYTGTALAATDDSPSQQDLEVAVMPNPSTTYFTLKITGRSQAPVQIRVMDATGRVVESKAQVQVGSTIQIGHSFLPGTYYTELVQGQHRKLITLLKVR